jgi:anthranilate phosphoribosyltransferase
LRNRKKFTLPTNSKNHKTQKFPDAEERMKGYLQKIATGPKMSKDLSEEEAEDALSLILNGDVSQIRAAVFLVAARMKRETQEENIGYWKALNQTTLRREVKLDKLIQIADPFDGFNRVPYFGFYVIPVLSALGLPAYGHSSKPQPPKFGITFENILVDHYGIKKNTNLDQRVKLIEEFNFGYLGLEQTNPQLNALNELRKEIVKRPMIATWEKMLMPLKARRGNYLAATYFHRGYEIDMLKIAELSQFNKVLLGNGAEGTTLFGVIKPTKAFIKSGENEPDERTLELNSMSNAKTAQKIAEAYEALKSESATPSKLATMGESALKGNNTPSTAMIACQAGTLSSMFGISPDPQSGFNTAEKIMQTNSPYNNLMRFIEKAQTSVKGG